MDGTDDVFAYFHPEVHIEQPEPVTANEARILELREDIASAEDEISDLDDEISSLQASIRAREREIKKMESGSADPVTAERWQTKLQQWNQASA